MYIFCEPTQDTTDGSSCSQLPSCKANISWPCLANQLQIREESLEFWQPLQRSFALRTYVLFSFHHQMLRLEVVVASSIPGSVGYISCVHWAYNYLGPFKNLGSLSPPWVPSTYVGHKNCVKKSAFMFFCLSLYELRNSFICILSPSGVSRRGPPLAHQLGALWPKIFFWLH